MNRLATLGLLALLLAGCGTARPALKADATAADLARADVCHTRAIAQAEESVPYLKPSPPGPSVWSEWPWWKIALAPLIVAGAAVRAGEGAALLVATSPVWVPWWLTKVHRERRDVYQRAYAGCVADPVAGEPIAEAEWDWP